MAIFKTTTLYERKLKQHPLFPFVYFYRGKPICIHHINKRGMNNGSLRQHIQGKDHKLNFDTGERIIESGIPNEILALIKLQDQEQKAKPTTIDFDKLKSQLEFILGDDPEAVKDLLASYAFDDKIKYALQERLAVNKKMKYMKNDYKLRVLMSKKDQI